MFEEGLCGFRCVVYSNLTKNPFKNIFSSQNQNVHRMMARGSHEDLYSKFKLTWHDWGMYWLPEIVFWYMYTNFIFFLNINVSLINNDIIPLFSDITVFYSQWAFCWCQRNNETIGMTPELTVYKRICSIVICLADLK